VKYSGTLGYSEDQVETPPDSGVWKDVIVERHAYGDVLDNNRRLRPGDQANDDLSITTTLSVVMDPYARDHFARLIYARWMGVLWTVQTVKVQYPRLVVYLGGEYNGPTAAAPDTTEVSDGGNFSNGSSEG
jgi:hypothetical protein